MFLLDDVLFFIRDKYMGLVDQLIKNKGED